MDEDVLIRAITIGASVFITLATITAVMMYYNTAKVSVTQIGTGTNIEENYRQDIKNILSNSEITGSEVKNVLQYFYNDGAINICIDRYYAYNDSGSQINVIPAAEIQNINAQYDNTYIQIFKTMMPNQRFKVTSSGNKYTFTLIT